VHLGARRAGTTATRAREGYARPHITTPPRRPRARRRPASNSFAFTASVAWGDRPCRSAGEHKLTLLLEALLHRPACIALNIQPRAFDDLQRTWVARLLPTIGDRGFLGAQPVVPGAA